MVMYYGTISFTPYSQCWEIFLKPTIIVDHAQQGFVLSITKFKMLHVPPQRKTNQVWSL
jgi:hypothetical protein